jgi:hypothetical protein
MRYILPIAAMLLTACSSAPLRVPINQNLTVNLPIVPPTFGAVIYAADAATFQAAAITPASVRLEGNAAATGVTAEVKAYVHGRTSDPASDGTCLQVSSVFVCLPNSGSRLGSEPITLKADASKTKFSLGDGNQETMKAALKNGKIWLGLEISQGFASNANLTISELEVIASLL